MGEVRVATDAARTFEMFDEDYTMLQTKLGVGTYASVHAAECKRTGKLVAVKVYDKSSMGSRAHRSAQAEIYQLKGLKHRGIVQLEGWYKEPHAVLVVLERLSGGDLVDWLEEKSKEGGCAEKDAIGITVQLLEALEYLHREGVIHRDVKLENIMFECEKRRVVKLVDFGFATNRSRGRKLTGKCGSFQYMAPEVLSGKGYDERCDIYSLGVVVCALLTSKFLAQDGGRVDFHRQLGQDPHLSQEAQEFVQWLVTKEPAHRPYASSALQHPWLDCLSLAEAATKKREDSPRALYRAWARDLGAVALLACGVRVEVDGASLWWNSSASLARRQTIPCPDISAPWPWLRWYEPVALH